MKNLFLVVLAILTIFLISASFAQSLITPEKPLNRNSFKQAANIANPSVVSIRIRLNQGFSPTDENQDERSSGIGSGVITDIQGYIITNKHVVAGDIRSIKIVLSTGEEFPAILKLKAPDTDIAILQATIPPEKLKPAIFRDSDTVEPGEIVVAIGSPFGLQNTVTQGIVSAIRVMPDTVQKSMASHPIIQTDAAINPGNSGGPLLDLDGNVIGINSFIFSGSGGSVGLGFAIPSNVAKKIYEQTKNGQVALGWIGISTQDLNDDLARIFSIQLSSRCLIITSIESGGPAQQAGLKQGDCIESVNNSKQTNSVSFEWLIRNTVPDLNLTLLIRSRNNQMRTVTVTVKIRP